MLLSKTRKLYCYQKQENDTVIKDNETILLSKTRSRYCYQRQENNTVIKAKRLYCYKRQEN
jgi:hypothetical protein